MPSSQYMRDNSRDVARTLPAVLTWQPLQVQSDSLLGALWNPKKSQWWAWSPTGNDIVELSDDDGIVWGAQITGTSGVHIKDGAIDGAGNMTFVGNSTTLTVYTEATNAWATHTPFTLISLSSAEVAYETTGALWAVYGTTEAAGWTGGQFMTSPDASSWTDQSTHLPAILKNGDGSHTAQARHVAAGGGYLVCTLMLAGVVHVSGAASSAPTVWSADAPITPTMSTPTSCTKPIYSEAFSKWFMAITGTNSGKACTEIWAADRSGAAWTQVKVLGGTTQAVTFGALVALGPLLVAIMTASWDVGITNKGVIAYSTDAGATWSPGPRVGATDATAFALAAGNGSLLEMDTGGAARHSQASVRVGPATGGPVLTT